ncbi:MAG: hypothetical protein ACI3XS_07285 [Eubacteriales bacterium]
MKKKDIKKTEEQLLSYIEVPDSVLDCARAELNEVRQEKEERIYVPVSGNSQSYGGAAARAIPLRGIMIAALCLVVAAAITLTVIFTLPKSNFSDAPVYILSELKQREIYSVALYNDEHGTVYLGAANGITQAEAYSDGVRDVMLKENFTFGETSCVWYVLTDSSDKSVDVLTPFFLCEDVMTIQEQQVFYDGNNYTSAYFYHGDATYFLATDDGEQEFLIAVLETLIAN